MAIDHYARAKRAWPLLVRRAQNGEEPFTYGELCARLGLHHRAAAWFLGVIQTYCHRHKLAPLQALVVNKVTRLPGSGYVGSSRTRAAYERALAKVRMQKWPPKTPNLHT